MLKSVNKVICTDRRSRLQDRKPLFSCKWDDVFVYSSDHFLNLFSIFSSFSALKVVKDHKSRTFSAMLKSANARSYASHSHNGVRSCISLPMLVI